MNKPAIYFSEWAIVHIERVSAEARLSRALDRTIKDIDKMNLPIYGFEPVFFSEN